MFLAGFYAGTPEAMYIKISVTSKKPNPKVTLRAHHRLNVHALSLSFAFHGFTLSEFSSYISKCASSVSARVLLIFSFNVGVSSGSILCLLIILLSMVDLKS